jgi:hypothetical protein
MSDFATRSDIQDLRRIRRTRQLALAILNRAKEAGIPQQYMRINQDKFLQILNSDFHGKFSEMQSFVEKIYNEPDFLLNRNFISIDGGNFESREIAGFAILFRIIAYDKIGLCYGCEKLRHRFETINSTSHITRNDLAEQLGNYDVLFLEELDKKKFSPHFDVGSFFDEVLIDRIHESKPTIVTFSSPVVSEEVTASRMNKLASDGELDSGCGKHLAWLSLTPKTTDKILRIRVNLL